LRNGNFSLLHPVPALDRIEAHGTLYPGGRLLPPVDIGCIVRPVGVPESNRGRFWPGATMAIEAECPLCGHKGSVPEKFDTKQVKCPECCNLFVVSPGKAAVGAKGGPSGSASGEMKLKKPAATMESINLSGGSGQGTQKNPAAGSAAGKVKKPGAPTHQGNMKNPTTGSAAGQQKIQKAGGSAHGQKKNASAGSASGQQKIAPKPGSGQGTQKKPAP